MELDKTDILVYAHWKPMSSPKLMGVLTAQQSKGRITYSFEYNREWLDTDERFVIDPDIQWFSGRQFPLQKKNFGVFLDSMPDTWGRTLMRRRAVLQNRNKNKSIRILRDIDYLLGVFDEARMGALRFKLSETGDFLDNNNEFPIPQWSSIRDLQYAANHIEKDEKNYDIKKWLAVLMAPGSSLGGARPKANVFDKNGSLWIAKFPAKNDVVDKALWEYLAYRLAKNAGISMAESKVEKVAGTFHTFFTKRFDRERGERIHFASAMTMTGNNEDTIRDNPVSYLDIAEFIQFYCYDNQADLHQLWRRIVFNIAISNTDDHLRNHGFILSQKGWNLSPAFDINPSVDKDGLALNINIDNNTLDFELAKSVGEFFMLDNKQMKEIINEVLDAVSYWQSMAKEIGIRRSEIELMKPAFKV